MLIVGYQAPGTLGALLQSGVSSCRIYGQEVKVAARIRSPDIYSGHAARGELLAWLQARLPIFRGVFLTHGEEPALSRLKEGVVALGLPGADVVIPRLDQIYVLHPGTKPEPIEDREAALSVVLLWTLSVSAATGTTITPAF